MTVRENVAKLIKDLVLPELQGLRGEVRQVAMRLDAVEKRLEDFNDRFQSIDQHLVDQSRRIDEQGGRIDALRTELTARIDEQGRRIDELRVELSARVDQQTARIDQLNLRVDQISTQLGDLKIEVGLLRQEQAVVNDLVRRVGQLEARAA
jgi:archaellum component FlaC